jgi:hypothetical protein
MRPLSTSTSESVLPAFAASAPPACCRPEKSEADINAVDVVLTLLLQLLQVSRRSH